MSYSYPRSQIYSKPQVSLENAMILIETLNNKVGFLEKQLGKFEQLETFINDLQQKNINLQQRIEQLEKYNNDLQSKYMNLQSSIEQLENQNKQSTENQSQSQPIFPNQSQNQKITMKSTIQTPNQIPSNINGISSNQKNEKMINQQQRPQTGVQQQNRQEMNQNNFQNWEAKSDIFQSQNSNNIQYPQVKQNSYYPNQTTTNQESPLKESRLKEIHVECMHCHLPIQQNHFQLSCSHNFHQECLLKLIQKQIYYEKAKSITCVCHKEIPSEFLSIHSTSIQEFDQLYKQLNQNQIRLKTIQKLCLNCKHILIGQQGNSQLCGSCQNIQFQGGRFTTQQPNLFQNYIKR